jgi:hypothetical protein
MRLLCEIFIIGGLIYLGWEKPFKEWIGQKSAQPSLIANTPAPQPILRVSPVPPPPSYNTAAVPPPRPSASVAGSWMFDPNHRSALDPPRRSATPH